MNNRKVVEYCPQSNPAFYVTTKKRKVIKSKVAARISKRVSHKKRCICCLYS